MTGQSLVRSKLTPADTQAIRMVLDGLPSEHSRGAYERARSDFFMWHRGVGRPQLSKAVVQRYAAELREAGRAPSSVNQRLSAIRKLAAEAADNGALDPQVANGIRAVKGARREGRRTGNWLTREEAQEWLGAPDKRTMRGRRDCALLAVLIGCGLRRSEAAGLTFEHVQQRDGRWVLVDLVGKRDKIRSVPMPNWAKAAIDEWSKASGASSGLVFRAVNKGGVAATPPECEGAACQQVAVTFDEAKGQYRVQNNSADAWVRVTASNMASAAEVCVAPGKSGYLSLKSIVGLYRAGYDASCGGGSDLSNVGAWQPAGEDAPVNGGTGWVYKKTEYDWKGRVKREVEADGVTDRLVEYEGCGCAGGEVMTVRGELVPTNDANAPSQARRTQKVYHDVLGRAVKSELLNWGGSVYSTATTLYDALDRAVRVRQYAGELTGEEPVADGTGYQTTRLEYDGHGRVTSRHLPVQIAGAATAYDYYADDAVRSVTDARGVKTEYEYDARHLLKKVRYNVLGVASVATDRPQGTTPVAPAPDVTYTYDAAGNRLTMVTDQGLGGSVTYHYDALSRLDWEKRTLPGLAGEYTLSYEYTLSGALRKMTDEAGGKTYTYDYDKAGQMAALKGTGFGTAEKTFAASAGYRAWGGPKGVSYDNGTSATFAYNSRGLLTQYRVTGLTQDGQYGNPQHGSDFEYYADGRVKYASDLFTDSHSVFDGQRLHDRAYAYDQAGRLKEAYSGSEANQFRTGTGAGVEGAFRQSYNYNAWGDVTGRTGRFWTEEDNTSEAYAATGRNPAWEYDPEGRLVSRNEAARDNHTYAPLRVSYDAAGRPHRTTQTTSAPRPLHPEIFDATQAVLTKTGEFIPLRRVCAFSRPALSPAASS